MRKFRQGGHHRRLRLDMDRLWIRRCGGMKILLHIQLLLLVGELLRLMLLLKMLELLLLLLNLVLKLKLLLLSLNRIPLRERRLSGRRRGRVHTLPCRLVLSRRPKLKSMREGDDVA